MLSAPHADDWQWLFVKQKTNSVAFSPLANYTTERPPLVDEI
jgi:hypothetical protein